MGRPGPGARVGQACHEGAEPRGAHLPVPLRDDTSSIAQDKAGDENWHIYAVELKTGQIKDLTPFEGISAMFEGMSPKHPERDR